MEQSEIEKLAKEFVESLTPRERLLAAMKKDNIDSAGHQPAGDVKKYYEEFQKDHDTVLAGIVSKRDKIEKIIMQRYGKDFKKRKELEGGQSRRLLS